MNRKISLWTLEGNNYRESAEGNRLRSTFAMLKVLLIKSCCVLFFIKNHLCWFAPCWSVLDFWKFNLEKSSSMNWIFSLFQTGFFTACVACKNQFRNWFLQAKNPVCRTWFFKNQVEINRGLEMARTSFCTSQSVSFAVH